jgi:Methyltransferase domain
MHLNARDVALNLLAAPVPVRNLLRRVRDRNQPLDYDRIVSYSLDRLNVRRKWIGDDRIRGSRMLEIGSGTECCLAVLLLALGARRIINVEIDSYIFIRDAALYRRLVERAAAEMDLPITWPPVGLIVEGNGTTVRPDPERISLHLGRSAAVIPERDASADVTFSIAVLEHIRGRAMSHVARELYRLTRSGGIGFHSVDLADHYSRKTEPFRFLRFTPLEYQLMYGNRGSSSNRLRIDDIEAIYREVGFSKVERADVRLYQDGSRFEAWRAQFNPEFRNRDPEMLRALHFMLVLEK